MSDARLKLALAACVLVGVAAIGVTLAASPLALARVSTPSHEPIGTTRRKLVACQANEVLPRETSAIRLRVFALLGPRVTVSVLADGKVIAHGVRGSGWTGGVVTVPVRPLAATRSGVELCFALFLDGDESGELVGEKTAPALAAQSPDGPLAGRVRVEDLRPGPSSWWSLAPSVARRMGLGHAWGGSWSAVLVLCLMAGVAVLCGRLVLGELE